MASRHFQHWYHHWGEGMQNMLHNDQCGGMFKAYLEGTMSWCSDEGCYVGSVVDCLLENTKESWKANMASAALILGLLPTLLAVGGRPNTVEVGLLSLRRPFLAFMLAVGAPGITSIAAFEHKSAIQVLQKEPDSLHTPKLSRLSAIAIVAIEYILACVAIANVVFTSWQLGVSSVCSMAYANTWLPLLWTCSTPLIYACGTFAIMLRIEFNIPQQGTVQKAGMLKRLFRHEMQLCSQQAQASVTFRRESYTFISLSLLTSLLAIVHLAFGTVLLSSSLFVGTGDAFVITARYFASTAVCRVILMFEMNGMRQTVDLRYEHTRNRFPTQSLTLRS
ncbi:hypothetical protein N7445_010722 [Penicillium cf. griseofulvum]|nr:hypothetical protein N7445_010722 [Penicillium cf. griseofulvum]